MASRALITDSLVAESGKVAPNVRKRIEEKVGEITVELLQQSEGRFKGLLREQAFTTVIDVVEYILNSDFNTAQGTYHEVDSNGVFKRQLTIVSKSEMFHRRTEKAYASVRLSYIDFLEAGVSGRGYYLVLGDKPTEAAFFRIPYFREATENDTDVIRKVAIVKRGVRGSLPSLFPNEAQIDAEIYLRHLQGFREKREKFNTTTIMTPSSRTGNFNRRMHKYGQGQ